MTLTKIPFRAGIVKDDPELTSEGTWVDGDNVRFVRGRAQKVGGYQRLIDQTVEGKARGLLSWVSNAGNPNIAIGTHLKLYVLFTETLLDITPLRDSGTLTDPFTTTAGSQTVVVTDAAHGLSVGDAVIFSGASAVGGITLSGAYRVVSVASAGSYAVQHTAAAGSGATGGGTVTFKYELPVGLEYGARTFGWGVSSWGEGTWGTARDTALAVASRTWDLASWGQNLLAVPRGGGLYEYTVDTLDRAVLVSTANGYSENAPTQIAAMFVTPERFVVLLGTEPFSGAFDPLLVRWADQETLDGWAPSPTNLAGEYRLAVGSRIVAGTVSRLQNLLWTDTALYAMRYLGDIEFVFGFELLGTNCGLAGPHAFAEKDGLALWMSPAGQFFIYDGSAPRVLPCPVRRYVFDAIVAAQFETVWCGVNSEFNEVWWWYATDPDAPEMDRYVAYSLAEDAWFIGTLARTAWIDKTSLSRPVAVAPDGALYVHETGVDAGDQALPAYIRAAPFDVGDGDQVASIHRIVPDLEHDGTVRVTLQTRRWPQDAVEMDKTRLFTGTSRKIDIRAQGRQASIGFAVQGVGEWFRLGDVRLDITPAGRR